MLFACWAAKGGAGATVVSCSLALVLARCHPGGALLVDFGGDAGAVLGCADADGPGLAGWLARRERGEPAAADPLDGLEVAAGERLALVPRGTGPLPPTQRCADLALALANDERAVVVDCGTLGASSGGDGWALSFAGDATHSLLVTRLCYLALRRAVRAPLRPSGVLVVSEPGRSLRAVDVATVLGVPVVAELPYDPVVARSVDAGLLGHRLPATLARAARGLVA
jgi:hypothetical protein